MVWLPFFLSLSSPQSSVQERLRELQGKRRVQLSGRSKGPLSCNKAGAIENQYLNANLAFQVPAWRELRVRVLFVRQHLKKKSVAGLKNPLGLWPAGLQPSAIV